MIVGSHNKYSKLSILASRLFLQNKHTHGCTHLMRNVVAFATIHQYPSGLYLMQTNANPKKINDKSNHNI